MQRTYIKDLGSKIGSEVRIRGRVDTIRDQGKILFVMVRDITGKVQTVVLYQDEESFSKAKSLTDESVVDILGEVKEAPQVAVGYEVLVKEIKIDSLATAPLPITIEQPHAENISLLDRRLDYRWIDLRSEKNILMMSVYTLMLNTLREFCIQNGFKEIQAPRIIGAASESGASVFEVKYFDKKAYLAQSPQFHKQMGIAADLEKVFNVGPVFRAEKSFTTRHLTEFTSFDVEIGYIDSYKDICEFEEKMIVDMLTKIKQEYGEEIERVFGVKVNVPKSSFPYLTVREAKEKLKKVGVPSKDVGDFSPEEEKAICQIMQEETGSEFLFMIDYPHASRAFYHMKNEDDPTLALGYDLFWKGLEITTGAQREHRLENLRENALERGIDEESLSEYFDYFKYGCPAHGGFAIGAERLLTKLLGLTSILEATYVPNTPNRLGRLITKK